MKEAYIAAATVFGGKRPEPQPEPGVDFKPLIQFGVDELKGTAVYLNIVDEIENVYLYGSKDGKWVYVDDVQYFGQNYFAACINEDYITNYTDDGWFAIGTDAEHYDAVKAALTKLEYAVDGGSSSVISYLNIAGSNIDRLVFTGAGLIMLLGGDKLKYVDLQKNNLAFFDEQGAEIEYLNLNNNKQLTKITTAAFPKLTKLECRHCALEEFPALPSIMTVKQLYIDDNNLSGELVINAPTIERVDVSKNAGITKLSIADTATKLKDVAAEDCTSLNAITMSIATLGKLNLSNTGFVKFSLTGAQKLSIVNMKKCAVLNSLELKQNPALKTIQVDGCNVLRSLNISNNALTSFDMTKTSASALSNLYIYNNNNLSALNITGFVGKVLAYGCPFSNDEAAAQAFAESITTLESGQTAELQINGSQYDLIAAAATAAGWTVTDPTAKSQEVQSVEQIEQTDDQQQYA